jgi:hypothetical protein
MGLLSFGRFISMAKERRTRNKDYAIPMPALNKRKVFQALGYRPHRYQAVIHRCRVRNRVNVAGRRFGKSAIGGHELTPEALWTYTQRSRLLQQGQRREFWIVGPEYSDSEKEFRVLWNDLTQLEVPFDHPGTYNNPQTGDMRISLWSGKFIVEAKSAKYPGTLVGEGLSGVIMAEAAKLKPSVWYKYIRPTLADFRGWSLFSTTPEGRNWLYQLWQWGQDPERRAWASWRNPSWLNPYVFPLGEEDPEIKDMQADMSEERFNQEVAALFTEYVGRVFKDFDEEIHVTDLKYRPDLPLYLAVDYGWTNPFVAILIQVDVFDNVYVIGEYRRTQMDITDIAAELQTWKGGLAMAATKLYPDPGEPGDSNVLCRELKLREEGNTGGELKWRLELIRRWLKLGPEHASFEDQKPKIFFDRSCKDGIREMNVYRYPKTADEAIETLEAPELPMKKDDHFPEALGRFMRSYFGGADEGDKRGRAVVRTARVS